MNSFDISLNSTKQILNLTRPLKADFRNNKILNDLAKQDDAEKSAKTIVYENFSPHPERLFSDSNLSSMSLDNDYGDNRRSLDYDKILEMKKMMSETSSLASLDRSRPISVCSENGSNFRPPRNNRNEKEKLEIKLINNWKDQDIPKMVATNQQKFFNILEKILFCLNDIRNAVSSEVVPPDGVEDWDRMRKRTCEFSSRFSRNYLYPLERQINLLQKMTQCTKNIAHRTIINIQIQLLTTYQNVFCALQIFRTHVTTCVVAYLLDKLKHLLEQINTLCKIHTKCINIVDTDISKYEGLVETLQKTCTIFLDTIEEETKEPQHPDSSCKLSLKLIAQRKERKSQECKKKNELETRLSMYSMPSAKLPKGIWKKSVDAVAREKFRYQHVMSRYKTAGYKNMKDEVAKKSQVELLAKPIKLRKSSFKTPIVTARNEDEIQTMVEFHKENVSQAPQEDAKEDVILKTNFCFDKFNENGQPQNMPLILQELCKSICVSNDGSVTQKQMDTLFKGLSEIAPNEEIENKEIGTKSQVPADSIPEENVNGEIKDDETCKNDMLGKETKISNVTNPKVENKSKSGGTDSKNKNRQIISVTGAKNAQLICMKSDYDYSTNSLKRLNITRTKTTENEKSAKNKQNRASKSALKQLPVIPNPEAFNVINYKLQYSQYVAGNTLYVKSKAHQPWNIIDNIAERLLRDLLRSTCKEILMDEALKDMFISEFR